jgi:LacI family transcriptional regulator
LGYTLLLKKLSRFDTGDVESILNALLARQVDGIIWAVSEVGSNRDWLQDRLPNLPVPIIFLTMHPQDGLSIVAVDNYQGGRTATEHLIGQGYRQIGHIAGPLSWWEARQRLAGWQDALADAGMFPAGRQWLEGNWSSESGEEAIRQLLAQYPEMEAVFVANDQMALSVLQVACRQGLRVPQELAVVGFDDIPEAAYFCPPLTTVQQNLHELGCIAARQVVQMIAASREPDTFHKPESIWLKPHLVVRESSVPRERRVDIR